MSRFSHAERPGVCMHSHLMRSVDAHGKALSGVNQDARFDPDLLTPYMQLAICVNLGTVLLHISGPSHLSWRLGFRSLIYITVAMRQFLRSKSEHRSQVWEGERVTLIFSVMFAKRGRAHLHLSLSYTSVHDRDAGSRHIVVQMICGEHNQAHGDKIDSLQEQERSKEVITYGEGNSGRDIRPGRAELRHEIGGGVRLDGKALSPVLVPLEDDDQLQVGSPLPPPCPQYENFTIDTHADVIEALNANRTTSYILYISIGRTTSQTLVHAARYMCKSRNSVTAHMFDTIDDQFEWSRGVDANEPKQPSN
ncbi:hypothetical protein C8Q74DRAFT_1219502 [Fomes fomentarius]|nr:hypothetical protein C8Q74DRAFT_1219502 [Fomes fomentarius]